MLIAIIALFSCEGNYKNIQKMNLKDEEPVAVGKTINLNVIQEIAKKFDLKIEVG